MKGKLFKVFAIFVMSLLLLVQPVLAGSKGSGFDPAAIGLDGNCDNISLVYGRTQGPATSKEDLVDQFVEGISRVSKDQDTFKISLEADIELYNWAVDKAQKYNCLPSEDNPIIQNSFYIHKISTKPYYPNDRTRSFEVLVSTGKDLEDKRAQNPSIKTSMEMADLASKLARSLEGLDDRAKLNYIDDWTSYHFNYDDSLTKYMAADGYRTGEFVCAGYTEIYKLICDYAGLGDRVELVYGDVDIEGSSGCHAWIIYYGNDGNSYLIDPTHNDYERGRKSCKKWFMIEEGKAQGYHKKSVLKPRQGEFNK